MTAISANGPYASANSVNASGQVAGRQMAGLDSQAFITGVNGTNLTSIAPIGSYYYYESDANGINDAGQVAGRFQTDHNPYHAFLTGPNGEDMTDLGTLGGSSSVAYGINNAGQVVGQADTSTHAAHAYVTGPNGLGMADLNTLVDLPDGIILTQARDINNVGQVIATATVIPEPGIYAMLIVGLGLVGFIARRKSLLA